MDIGKTTKSKDAKTNNFPRFSTANVAPNAINNPEKHPKTAQNTECVITKFYQFFQLFSLLLMLEMQKSVFHYKESKKKYLVVPTMPFEKVDFYQKPEKYSKHRKNDRCEL